VSHVLCRLPYINLKRVKRSTTTGHAPILRIRADFVAEIIEDRCGVPQLVDSRQPDREGRAAAGFALNDDVAALAASDTNHISAAHSE
jgi:hypothetical protein